MNGNHRKMGRPRHDHSRPAAGRRRFRPALFLLEDRRLMTTVIPVTSALDTGSGTLRDALALALDHLRKTVFPGGVDTVGGAGVEQLGRGIAETFGECRRFLRRIIRQAEDDEIGLLHQSLPRGRVLPRLGRNAEEAQRIEARQTLADAEAGQREDIQQTERDDGVGYQGDDDVHSPTPAESNRLRPLRSLTPVVRTCTASPVAAAAMEFVADHVTRRTPAATVEGVLIALRAKAISIEKSRRELGYAPRPIEAALRDAIGGH